MLLSASGVVFNRTWRESRKETYKFLSLQIIQSYHHYADLGAGSIYNLYKPKDVPHTSGASVWPSLFEVTAGVYLTAITR